jgi:nucleoside-diphosphate-sugar epimerase
MPTVLVVGGTGQTGPLVVEGLVARGHDVTVMHSGMHEPPLPPVEHIHADVHFAETIAAALGNRTFDLAVCMYGRSRLIADELRGRVPRLIVVTGSGYAYFEPRRTDWGPFGVTIANEESPFAQDRQVDSIGPLVAKSENHVLKHQMDGHYAVTILRYPNIFGPNSVATGDWSIVRRALDKRPFFIVADGGLRLRSRAYRDNAAHATLLAVDNAEIANGQIYNVADDPPWLTVGQWIHALARALGHHWELVDLPIDLVEPIYLGHFGYHRLVDTSKIRDQLGYADVVSPEQAANRTAFWWAEHGEERIGDTASIPDRFDYAAEDALVLSYGRAVKQLLSNAPAPLAAEHYFRHPKRPGDTSAGGLIVDGGRNRRPRRTYPYDVTSAWPPDGNGAVRHGEIAQNRLQSGQESCD